MEACPEDAIRMTGLTLPQYFRERQTEDQKLGSSRSDFIFNRDMLVANNDISQEGLSVDAQ